MNKIIKKLRSIWHAAYSAPYAKTILVLQFFSGLFGFIGLPMLVPVLNYVGDANASTSNQKYLGIIENVFHLVGMTPNFLNLLIVAFVLILLGNVLVTVSTLLAVYSLADGARNYRKKIFDGYSKISWPWLVDRPAGDLHFAVIKQVDQASQACLDGQRVIIYGVQIIVLLAVAIKLSWTITLMAVAVYGLLGIVNAKKSGYMRMLGIQHMHNFFRLSNTMTGLQQNKKFVKTSLSNNQVLKPVDQFIDQLADAIKKENLYISRQQIFNLVVTYLFLFVLMCFHKQFSLGYADLILILTIFSRLAPNFNLLMSSYASLSACYPMMELVEERLKDLRQNQEANGSIVLKKAGLVTFDKVYFNYPNGKQVFEGLQLTIEPYKTTAFIGASGSGKSTLLDLILGLLSPTKGNITYDGINHTELEKNSLREMTAYLSQETTLTDGTFRENLTIRAESVSEEKINAVLKKVDLDQVVAQMPQGLDTPIGENGIKLSGGQRQRLALARALLMEPKILILDEATSSLDIESEQVVQKTIQRLQDEFTIIIVSHKLSAIQWADQIYVIDKGKISEAGRFQELLDKKGKLYSLFNLQQQKA